MAKPGLERWLGAALLFLGVCLIAAGIGLILRNDYAVPTGWRAVWLPFGAIFLGTVLVFIPAFRWFIAASKPNPPSKG
jgi:hypothetical protein